MTSCSSSTSSSSSCCSSSSSSSSCCSSCSIDWLTGCVVWLQVHPKFLSSISTCCLYIAAKANESAVLTSSLRDLLVVGQSGGSVADLIYTERLIVELLGANVMEAAATCNPLSFLRMFHNILLVDCAGLDSGSVPALDLALLVSKLEVIVCHFDFTRFHVSPSVSHRTARNCHAVLRYSVSTEKFIKRSFIPFSVNSYQ